MTPSNAVVLSFCVHFRLGVSKEPRLVEMNIIPLPSAVQPTKGTFLLNRRFLIHCESDTSREVAVYLVSEAEKRYGLIGQLQETGDETPSVVLCIQDSVDLLEGMRGREEGYTLSVTEEGIFIMAESRAGLFYGVQSLFQLLPFSHKLHPEDVHIPCMRIVDAPQFPWRGALLDVGRHFFKLSFVKRFIDHLAFYKLNRFHWHLTEDQGWRIEIKSLPKLTEIGAWREDENGDGLYGGFYTQNEIREIVSYAKERCIEVMPEIEMPGHCAASLAAYPSLSCRENAMETPVRWGVYEDVYCAGKDKVLDFLKEVLDEVIQLFPFEYIHIGGDEAPRDRWRECEKCQERIQKHELQGEDELQSWFISEIAEFLAHKERKIIGWDEILEGGIPSRASVMSWRGSVGGYTAAKLGHDVVMSPTSHCYFDYRQSNSHSEPGAYYATLPLESVYAFEPIPNAHLLVRAESPGSPDLHLLPRMEISEVSDTTLETAGIEVEECQSKIETQVEPNGCDEASTELRPEQRLADDIQSGRIPAELTESEKESILGGQANVWTEYIDDEETCEYMMFPRLCAFSETVWSPRESRDLDDFYRRLEEHVKIFDVLDIKYRPLTK